LDNGVSESIIPQRPPWEGEARWGEKKEKAKYSPEGETIPLADKEKETAVQ